MGNREEFEQELERYLAQRRKSRISIARFLNALKPRRKMPDKVELPPEVEAYGEPEQPPKETPPPAPSEEELTTEEKSALTRFLEKIGLISSEEQGEEEKARELIVQDEVRDDFKEVAKITLAVIKQLPPEQMGAFKNSPDFERLKTILKKHNLIK